MAKTSPPQAQTSINFYYYPGTRSSRVHWALEELKLIYEMTLVDLKQGAHQQESYKAIHPLAKVPALTIDGTTMFESLGIVLFLADRYPALGLAPEVHSAQRAEYYQWMCFAIGTLEPAVTEAIRCQGKSPKAIEAFGMGPAFTPFARIANHLETKLSDAPWLVGGDFTMADLMVASVLLWAQGKGLLQDYPDLEQWLENIKQRPAYQAIQSH